MIDDVTDEHRHTRNHGIEEDELCQMTIDGTDVDTVEVELEVRQLEDSNRLSEKDATFQ